MSQPDAPSVHDDDALESEVASEPRGRRGPRSNGWVRPVVAVVLILGFGAVGLVGAAILNARTASLYASDAIVRVYNPYRLNGSQFGPVDMVTVANLELQYAKSPSVERAARDLLSARDVDYDRVQWTPQTSSATLTVRCFAKGANASAVCAQNFANAYLQARSDSLATPLNKQVDSLTEQINTLTLQVKKIQAAINETPTVEGAPSDRNRGRLAQQQALLTQLSNASQARDDAKAQAAVVTSNFEIVAKPTVPDNLAQPAATRNLAVGLAVGLLVGLTLAVAFVRRGGQPRDA